jgi:prevent-host-death family protein
MKTVNMHQAKTQLSKLVEEVEHGEEVVIARAGRPVARLVGVHTKQAIKLGVAPGLVRYIAKDFDAPLHPEFLMRPLRPRRAKPGRKK